MGGIGKTTVSSWVSRNDAVRTQFGTIAWITLGQTPMLDACVNLLYLQLSGAELTDGLSTDQKHEHLKQAFLNKSVLLVLDDCWDADVAKQFTWIDPKTNSKVLISSRVREVLDSGDIVEVTAPSKSDAVKMLLSTAGMDVDALQSRTEVQRVIELCKQLPLTIGVAGKLIRQMSHGSSMLEASDWTDIVALLEDEMNDPEGSLSIEESVIRASIKAIPAKIQKQVTQLFHGFALVPEDTHVPLPVLGMIYDAYGKTTVPLSRMRVRKFLKVLIDRSLVLGTVDRPQLHDVMLDYVQKELAGEDYKAAQRRFVEELRKSTRSTATATGKYIHQRVEYHIKESHDSTWEKSAQATAWLEDHIHGVQDVIATSAASVLPAETMAREAEAAEMWWKAALRWNAFGLRQRDIKGYHLAGKPYFELAVAASAKATAVPPSSADGGNGGDVTQFDLDSFALYGIAAITKSWNPVDIGTYNARIQDLVNTEACRTRPLMCYSVQLSFDWYPTFLAGQHQAYVNVSWKMVKTILDMFDEASEMYALTSEEDRAAAKPFMTVTLLNANDAVLNSPEFSWTAFGANGDKLVEHQRAYKFEEHHDVMVELLSVDTHSARVDPEFVLAMQFGRISDVKTMMDEKLTLTKKLTKDPASTGYILAMWMSACFIPQVQHILGLTKHLQKTYGILGLTFDNAQETLCALTKPAQPFFTELEQKEPGGGLIALKRIIWQVKSFCVLRLDVPKAKAIAWLEALPDNETVIAYSMTFPTHDHGCLFGSHQSCWIALAHEKHGLYDGAIRFADLELGPQSKAGAPLIKWPQVIALACKGRVLAKLGRHDEALAAFQAGIATSKESYSLMEVFAYRELANYEGGGDACQHAAVRAGIDLEEKLKTFEGRMTHDDFDALTIGPG